MMAAATAASRGASVLLLEKNKRLGEKLRITGGGRCNVYNAEEDMRTLLKNYGKSEKFLYSAFTQFGMQESADYFNSRGLATKIEDRKRAFPTTNKALDVLRVLEQDMTHSKVEVLTDVRVESIQTEQGSISSICTSKGDVHGHSYILATGGTSRPDTGSTGDGFKWLRELGHTVDEPSPSITPLKLKDSWPASVAGKSAEVELSLCAGNKKKFKQRGRLLFTHYGVSGPLVLNNAYRVAELLESSDVHVAINFYPELDREDVDKKVVQALESNRAKMLKNVLKELLPGGLSPIITQIIGKQEIEAKNCSELSKVLRSKIVDVLCGATAQVDSLMGFDKAVVADGGLALENLDTKTMRSKEITNLYVTGDLLNINRPSGGYSLQLCWTTGYIAGINAARN